MAQAYGYGGLNFREIAIEVGIKSASIHYHFPTKVDLGVALAKRYTADAHAFLDECVNESTNALTSLKKFADMYRIALQNGNRMCLFGYMAAEHEGLPDAVKIEVRAFTDMNVEWLAKVLSRLAPATPSAEIEKRALAIYAAVSGAQLAARSRADVSVYDALIETYRQLGLIPGEA